MAKNKSIYYEDTDCWKQYRQGVDYKTKISLHEDVNKNTRMYEGRQWEGVVSNGLPTPVINVIRRIIDHKVNTIMADDITATYSVDGISDLDYGENAKELREVSKVLSAYYKTLSESLQEDAKNEQALLDAALTGDGIEYFYWDSNIKTGNKVKGNINSETVDNVNYFPSNPNSSDIQSQQYIIIAFRKMVSELKKEAKNYKCSQSEIEKIVSDEETEYQAGDLSKIELDSNGEIAGKAICLLKMWKQDGKVYFIKKTRYMEITNSNDKGIDSGLTLYPIAKMSWALRKNCCHGTSEVKGIIPNQIAINKLTAMVIMCVMHTAFPKLVFDNTRIAAVSNMIGASIGVNGGNIKDAIGYITPGQLASDIYKVIDVLIQLTKDMAGATDAALGDMRPENTSAIIVLQKAASIPLKSISNRYYRFNEDKARIFMDFFLNKYNVDRTLTYKENGVTKTFVFNSEKFGDMIWNVKIDVGASSHWSEVTALQTLDNLLMQQQITFDEYLERVPNGIIPLADKLLQDRLNKDTDRQVMFKLMTDYLEGLPPEMQAQIQGMKPEDMEQALKEMILQQEGGANSGVSM